MKLLFALLAFLAAQSTFADTLQSSIASIERGRTPLDDTLVMLSKDGQVGYLSATQSEILQSLELGQLQDTEFEITLDENHYITGVQAIPKSAVSTSAKTADSVGSAAPSNHAFDVAENYTPTIVPDMATATAIFKELNPNSRNNSQCYNRAEVWSYEEFTRRQLYSKKVFLFFTTKYIRDYHYKWWFHVSPYILVNDNGTVTEEVIDYVFVNKPTPLKEWTDIFMQPKTDCTSVDTYSAYSKNQDATYCYVIKTSMYFWQPQDIQHLETGTPAKTEFVPGDVSYAYKQGFR